MPWDPKPQPPPQPQQQPPQQQPPPHNAGLPNTNVNGLPPTSYSGYENSVPAPANGAPRVKTEPGMEQQQQPQQQYHGLPPMSSYSQINGGQGGGAARAQQLVEQQFGPQATAGFQRNGLALPGQQQQQQQAKPPQGLQLPPNNAQQMHQQYQHQQQQAMQQRQQQQLNQQQQNPQIKVEGNGQGAPQGQYQQQQAPNYSQTDGADDALDEWRAMLAEHRALAANQTERANHMMRERIAALSDDLQSGLMLPLDDQQGRLQTRRLKAAALKSKAMPIQAPIEASTAPAIAQMDGDAADDEEDEDAINSDLDDPDDDNNQINDDDDDNGDTILCTYDKVQRVKNKWKCTLKDGVLNANGREWLFHKGNGEFEW